MNHRANSEFSNTTDGTFGESKIDWEKSLIDTAANNTSSAAEATTIDSTLLSAVTFIES